MKLLIINGPNLNLLGLREPAIYGTKNYAALVEFCESACREAGFACEVFQSNHEGAIVDKIQAAYVVFDGIVINPSAYTHTIVAILDGLKAVALYALHGPWFRGLPAGCPRTERPPERRLKTNQRLLFFPFAPRYTQCVWWGFLCISPPQRSKSISGI